jgi:alpha-glucosidase (family GH31 glycosyl hydrolase)
VDQPLSISIYPGADGSFALYEDDGSSFNYRKGMWMGTKMTWNDASRKLTLTLAPDSHMLPPGRRRISVNLLGAEKNETFDGSIMDVHF